MIALFVAVDVLISGAGLAHLPSESYSGVLKEGGGNLIAAGHPGHPPLARGLYPEQGHEGQGLKTRLI